MHRAILFTKSAIALLGLTMFVTLQLMVPAASATEAATGCEFSEPTGDFACTKKKSHIYQGSCEGDDCYFNIETCCPLVS